MAQIYGGPLDGQHIEADVVDEVGFYRCNERHGYYFDGIAYHHAFLEELEHETTSGHTWIFIYTCRRRIARACGYLTQRCSELFTWRDAAMVTQKLRDMEWEEKNGLS